MALRIQELWQLQDVVTTVANANGYGVWGLEPLNGALRVELDRHLDDSAASDFCAQLPGSADYWGEGDHGSVFVVE